MRPVVVVTIDTEAFPRDFAVFTRYHHAVSTMLPERYPLPQPLPLGALDEILAGAARSHGIRASG